MLDKDYTLKRIEEYLQPILEGSPINNTIVTDVDGLMFLYQIHPIPATLLASGNLKQAHQVRQALMTLYKIVEEWPDAQG